MHANVNNLLACNLFAIRKTKEEEEHNCTYQSCKDYITKVSAANIYMQMLIPNDLLSAF